MRCAAILKGNDGYTGAVNAFTQAMELAKGTGNRRAEDDANRGMQATMSAIQKTERETGAPLAMLMVGAAYDGSELPQITHEGSRRGVGQEEDALEVGDCVMLHSLQTFILL